MYSNVQSLKMYGEGENRPPIGGVLVYKNMVKIFMPLVINCLDNMSSLQCSLVWFGFAA